MSSVNFGNNDLPTTMVPAPRTRFEQAKQKVSSVWNKVKSVFETVGKMLASAGRTLKKFFGSIKKGFEENNRVALIVTGIFLVIIGFALAAAAPVPGILLSFTGGNMVGYNAVQLYNEANSGYGYSRI